MCCSRQLNRDLRVVTCYHRQLHSQLRAHYAARSNVGCIHRAHGLAVDAHRRQDSGYRALCHSVSVVAGTYTERALLSYVTVVAVVEMLQEI
jgi:hypothetical protein